MSENPQYFAIAEIGRLWPDPTSMKGNHFAEIRSYQRFAAPIHAKRAGGYFEAIPDNRATNYRRNGVRPIDEKTFLRITEGATFGPATPTSDDLNDGSQGTIAAFESSVEGQQKQRYATTYERDPGLRQAFVALHGTTCVVCGLNFGKVYGEIGAGYVHIHHRRPVSELDGPTEVNPKTDLLPVCADCHAVIHRRRGKTLSVEELKAIVESRASGNRKGL